MFCARFCGLAIMCNNGSVKSWFACCKRNVQCFPLAGFLLVNFLKHFVLSCLVNYHFVDGRSCLLVLSIILHLQLHNVIPLLFFRSWLCFTLPFRVCELRILMMVFSFLLPLPSPSPFLYRTLLAAVPFGYAFVHLLMILMAIWSSQDKTSIIAVAVVCTLLHEPHLQ